VIGLSVFTLGSLFAGCPARHAEARQPKPASARVG
jgi:hypothetical protein